MRKLFCISLFLFALNNVIAQVTLELKTMISNEVDLYSILVTNYSVALNNSQIAFECTLDGHLIYQAETRPLTLSPGMNELSFNLVQPIQITIDELSTLSEKEKVIFDVKLIQNGQIIARERQTITMNLGKANENVLNVDSITDKFGINGNINVLGQISDRQGQGSSVPQNYLRSNGNATLSFSHIPVDVSYFLTTEQTSYRQSMNRGAIRLNVPQMKRNLKQDLEKRVEKEGESGSGPTDSELENFKKEMIQKKYPDYKKWKQNFGSEEGAIQYKAIERYLLLSDFLESNATDKNLKRFRKLKEKTILSNDENSELKELNAYLIEIAQYQNEKIKIEDSMENTLEELIEGYNYLDEADQYYNDLDITDYNKANSDFNPFRLYNKTEKFLSQFQSVSVGTSAPYFSRMTLSGLLVNGVQFEVTPGNFYFSGVYGKSTRETFNMQFDKPTLTLSQGTLGLKFGYGKPSDSHLHFSFVQIEDGDSDMLEDSGMTAQKNRIISVEGKISLLDNKMTIEGELVGSLLTRDKEAVSLDNNLKSSMPLSFLYPEGNSTSSFDHAYSIGLQYNIDNLGLNVNGDMERLNPNFISLGAPTLLSNVLRWNVSARKTLINNKIQLGLRAGKDNNSLNPLLSDINNSTESYGIDVNIAFPNLPQIFASYAPFAQNSIINATGDEKFTNTKLTNISISYPYNFGDGFRANTQVGYNNQSLVSNVEGANSRNTTYSISQNINYKQLGINGVITHTPGQVIEDINKDITSLNMNATFQLDKLNTSLGLQLLEIPNQEMKVGYLANINYGITEMISADFRAQRNIYDNSIGTNSFKEYFIQTGLSIRFGGKKDSDTPYEEKPSQVNESITSEIQATKNTAVVPIITKSSDTTLEQFSKVDSIQIGDDNLVFDIVKERKVSDIIEDVPEVIIEQVEEKQEKGIFSLSKAKHYKVFIREELIPEKSFLSLSHIGPVYFNQVDSRSYYYYIGFYKKLEQAERTLAKVKRAGYNGAKIFEFDEGVLINMIE